MSEQNLQWDHPTPFISDIEVTAEHIDHYGHVNNCEYIRWLEVVAWAHSDALGLTLERYRELDRGMVVHRHEVDYLAPAYLGERLQIATWIERCDGKLTLERRFQLQRVTDGVTLMRAHTRFICVQLSTGKAKRMPAEYASGYGAVALESVF
ncbi:acyl-CoA thioesterase [Aestuariirhabdus litorea]|uniref:Acyl-CoA thioesterase n=1 Tax=Aestuariirhabdus litorea TaxID=2528527 RepID=A0A3P3VQA2_9GAMM|nr:thioesterase family protein [Aestuariirhabdus litorea]RRJ84961.1 acyl-CoA thioesterase [Aestuariirhabdus litorea]RWW98185.1 acyl-CoA thioesterase [Endozoicomonadaceae bacterium GTF-13]